MLDLNRFVSKQTTTTAAKTLNDLMEEFDKGGFVLSKPDHAEAVVHLSARNKWQMLFLHKDDNTKRIYVQISHDLIASIKAKKKGVELEKSPVYINHPFDENNKPIMDVEVLSVGSVGVSATPVAKGTALLPANFVEAEPAGA